MACINVLVVDVIISRKSKVDDSLNFQEIKSKLNRDQRSSALTSEQNSEKIDPIKKIMPAKIPQPLKLCIQNKNQNHTTTTINTKLAY